MEGGTLEVVTVDLGTLPAGLANAVKTARDRRRGFVPEPFSPREPDAALRAWARDVVRSGELAAAIAEVAAEDPDLRS